MAKDKDFEIIVNTTPYTVEDQVVTYDQVVEIAFPGHPNDPLVVYSVTFEHAKEPHHGPLGAGGSVEVKNHGTIFDVTQASRS